MKKCKDLHNARSYFLNTMKLCCTGTRNGTTKEALTSFRHWLAETQINISEAHHGDCIGADTQFHEIMCEMAVHVFVHPCTLEKYRSFNTGGTISRPLNPTYRNKKMVDLCDLVVAFPEGPEVVRSGTWSTIRYASKRNKSCVIFWRDGSVSYVSR